jgi:uncharacterized glyoxalase superfamily protein PhnB
MADIFDLLRDMPDEHFRISLKESLMEAMTTTPERASHLPEGFRSVTPYLITANASGVIDFLKAVFEATEKMRAPTPEGTIMHGEVIVGDSVIELSDGNEKYPPSPAAVHVYVPDVDIAYNRAIFAGATSIFEPADQPYGDRACAVRDGSGNHWYIATHLQRAGEFLPGGMHSITPFLHPPNAEGQIRFLLQGLGGEELSRHVDAQTFYAKVRIDSGVVELSEARGQVPSMPASIHIHVPDCDAVYNRALAAGGTSIDPVTDHPYGERSGGVRDPFGNRWWIATKLTR